MSISNKFNPKTTAPCRTVEFSSDGKYLVEVNYLGFITIRDAHSGDVLNRIMGQTTLAEIVRFQPNSNLLYVAGAGFEGYRDFGSVMVYEIPSGKRIREISGHKDDIIDICFPGKDLVATVGYDGLVIVHNLENGTKWYWNEYNEYISACTSRPGHPGHFAVAGDSGYSYVLDCLDRKEIAKVHTPSDSNALIWSNDGRHLLVGGDDSQLQYFDSEKSWERIRVIQLGGAVKKACYDSMFQNFGLAACYDGKIWSFPLDPKSEAINYIVVENIEGIWGTNVASSRNMVAVPSFGDIAFLMERDKSGVACKPIGKVPAPTFGCNWITINKSENTIVSTHDDGKIRIRNADNGMFIREIAPPTSSLLMGADFHPSLPLIATIDFQGELFLMNYKTEELIFSKKMSFGPGVTLNFNKTGNLLAVGGYGPDGWILELSSEGKLLESVQLEQPNTGVVKSILFTSENEAIVGSGDGTLVLHAKTQGKWNATRHIRTNMELCNAITFGEDKKIIFSAARDQTIRSFDSMSGAELQCGYCHTRSIKSIHISEDQKYIVTGSYDRTAIVWDAATLTVFLPPLRMANAGISSVKFHGNRVYTCSFDGFVCCWDMKGSLVWFKDSINHSLKN